MGKRMLGYLQMSAHLGYRLIPDMLQMLFGYRHYANIKCSTSFPVRVWDFPFQSVLTSSR